MTASNKLSVITESIKSEVRQFREVPWDRTDSEIDRYMAYIVKLVRDDSIYEQQ